MKIHIETYNRLKFAILDKLHHKEMWENVYMPIERALKAVKGHDRGYAKDVVDDLRKDGLIFYHKNNTCVSLSSSKKPEIEAYLAENEGKFF